MHRQRGRVALLWLIAVSLGLSGLARADVKTERSGSIVVFPKVIATDQRDTIIQLSNTSNSMVRAHCFYVNGALKDPSQPEGPTNMPLWQEIDFDITLTKQQPTHWTVSQGRNVNPFDPACTGAGSGVYTNCDGAGFDPGLIPPVIPGFTGELKCVEVDDSGAPLSGNHLKGEAMLVTAGNHDISEYDALSILGNENNGDGTLVLGAGQCVGDGAQNGAICKSDSDCGDSGPCAQEYNACPQTWILDHQAERTRNLALRPDLYYSEVETELTVVPCTENFETQVPTSVTLQFDTSNEFESHFSVSTTITCWGDFLISDLNSPALTREGTQVLDPQGSMFLQTRIRSAGGTPFGVLMVAEEYHAIAPAPDTAPDATGAGMTLGPKELENMGDNLAAAAAENLHVEGTRSTPDVITIPNDQLIP